MNTVSRDIFRAIHEGKWLSIEYRNREEKITKYWIGIRSLDVLNRTMAVDGLHLRQFSVKKLDRIRIDAILSSYVVEGSYCPVNQELVQDIRENSYKYESLFGNVVNLKILNYLEMCNRMDTTPYLSDFELVQYLDRECIEGDSYQLSQEQFQTIVKYFHYQSKDGGQKDRGLKIRRLAMNVLSIHTTKGLYVLAYRGLNLDVKQQILKPEPEITICTEFTLDGMVQSARRFLEADDYELLHHFERNQEKIKDRITTCFSKRSGSVDDLPYIIGLGMDIPLDLHREYESIVNMIQSGEATIPIRAFFGDLLERPIRRGAYPIALINHKINLDQLLAIHNAMKYPVAYIQGPPGTGKTNTILNTIVTAFFNERTVLFVSYNNHPINSVYDRLSGLNYRGKTIPFPILRLGNKGKVREALRTIHALYEAVQGIQVFTETLDRNRDDRKKRARRLSDLLRKYEEQLDLKEREETIDRLLEYDEESCASAQMLPFEADLKGRQKIQIERRLQALGDVSEREALSLLDDDTEELKKYLYYISAGYVQKIGNARNSDLREILEISDEDTRVDAFSRYLSKKENIAKLQKIFPIIATTCISAQRLGEAEPMFDMVIMDEASQCNTAVALVPIARGSSLMLVGDPQQLNPVILLDETVNDKLKKRYGISEEYDYRKNSIYKTCLACDAVSDEILLHNHYRCDPKIIDFNNRKYYHSQLNVLSKGKDAHPLLYVDMQDAESVVKNTAPEEARMVAQYVAAHRDKKIGVITPFVNQKKAIEAELERVGEKNAVCGTIHAFQGDEKDIVLFSTAITDQTTTGTYDWLKNNKELINVATSRAKDRLIVLSSRKNLDRLHRNNSEDDLYELAQYVWTNGESSVTPKQVNSRALGVKPFSTEIEEAFLQNLNHALENIWLTQSRFIIHKEVVVSQVFSENEHYDNLFYNGRFDFVVYEKQVSGEHPVLAIELDGKEHIDDAAVMVRERRKKEICESHNIQLIHVENSYARRYNHIKKILMNYFSVRH